MTSWRKTGWLAALVAGLIVIVQIAVPVARLADDEPASRFGWQMFSRSRPFPEFVVATPDGDLDIALSDYLVRQRVEIDMARALPPHLCEEFPDASVVRWENGEHRC